MKRFGLIFGFTGYFNGISRLRALQMQEEQVPAASGAPGM